MEPKDNKPIILITSSYDSNSIFHDFTPGASKLANAVLILIIAETLSRSTIPLPDLPKHILFSVFGAETWSFAGSRRFVKDIKDEFICKKESKEPSGTCPYSDAACINPCFKDIDFKKIDFSKIDTMIEFDIGGLLQKQTINLTTELYFHIDQQSPLTTSLMAQFQPITTPGFNKSTNAISLTYASASGAAGPLTPLPPSSIMAFLNQRRDIPAVLIADYQTSYTNKVEGSEYDTGSLWGDDHISLLCGLATSVARAVANGAASPNPFPNPQNLQADCSKLAEYLSCMTRNFSCPPMKTLLPNKTLSSSVSAYAGVFSFRERDDPGYIPFFINRVLANATALLSGKTCVTDMDCQRPAVCLFGKCGESLTRYHDAYGDGLDFDHEGAKWSVTDPSSGTWTESTWSITKTRIFLTPSVATQSIQLAFAVLLNAAVFWLVRTTAATTI